MAERCQVPLFTNCKLTINSKVAKSSGKLFRLLTNELRFKIIGCDPLVIEKDDPSKDDIQKAFDVLQSLCEARDFRHQTEKQKIQYGIDDAVNSVSVLQTKHVCDNCHVDGRNHNIKAVEVLHERSCKDSQCNHTAVCENFRLPYNEKIGFNVHILQHDKDKQEQTKEVSGGEKIGDKRLIEEADMQNQKESERFNERMPSLSVTDFGIKQAGAQKTEKSVAECLDAMSHLIYDQVQECLEDVKSKQQSLEQNASSVLSDQDARDNVTITNCIAGDKVHKNDTKDAISRNDTEDDAGKNDTADDLGRNDTDDEVGRNDTANDLGRNDTDDEVGRNDTEDDVGRNDTDDDVGRNDTDDDVGRNDTDDDVGRNDTEDDIGKNETQDYIDRSDTEDNIERNDTEDDVDKNDTEDDVERNDTEDDVYRNKDVNKNKMVVTSSEDHLTKFASNDTGSKIAEGSDIYKSAGIQSQMESMTGIKCQVSHPKENLNGTATIENTESLVQNASSVLPDQDARNNVTITHFIAGDKVDRIYTKDAFSRNDTEDDLGRRDTDDDVHRNDTNDDVGRNDTEDDIGRNDTVDDVERNDTEYDVDRNEDVNKNKMVLASSEDRLTEFVSNDSESKIAECSDNHTSAGVQSQMESLTGTKCQVAHPKENLNDPAKMENMEELGAKEQIKDIHRKENSAQHSTAVMKSAGKQIQKDSSEMTNETELVRMPDKEISRIKTEAMENESKYKKVIMQDQGTCNVGNEHCTVFQEKELFSSARHQTEICSVKSNDNEDIHPASLFAASNTYGRSENGYSFVSDVCKLKIQIYKANITELEVDCIVNAANENLLHYGGVAKAISDAAGPTMIKECKNYIKDGGILDVTDIFVSTGGKLFAEYVIHAVGPKWESYDQENKSQCFHDLRHTVIRCLVEANRRHLTSIAFPSISAAIFRVPKEQCARCYLDAVKHFDMISSGLTLQEIHFVDVDNKMVDIIAETFKNDWSKPSDAEIVLKDTEFVKQYLKCAAKNEIENSRIQSLEEIKDTDNEKSASSTVLEEDVTGAEEDEISVAYQFGNLILHVNSKHAFDITSDIIFTVGQPFDKLSGSHDCKLLEGLELCKIIHCKENMYTFLNVSQLPGSQSHVLCQVYPDPNDIETISEAFKNLAVAIQSSSGICKAVIITSSLLYAEPSNTQLQTGKRNNLHVKNVARFAASLYDFLNNVSERIKNDISIFVVGDEDALPTVVKVIESHNVLKLESTAAEISGPEQFHTSQDLGATPLGVVAASAAETGNACDFCGADKSCSQAGCCEKWLCKDCEQDASSCPFCQKIRKVITGNQPPGSMTVTLIQDYADGYEDCKAWQIEYVFPEGKQKEWHPSPGKAYDSVERVAYLPVNEIGYQVLLRLRLAFIRNLIFTIGYSESRNVDDVIVWGGISHKTKLHGGKRYGYPDPDYLNRVTLELSSLGVQLATLTESERKQISEFSSIIKAHKTFSDSELDESL